MPRGMKLHHGTELSEGKEKGESKKNGRWKGKITKYRVTINTYMHACIHTYTHAHIHTHPQLFFSDRRVRQPILKYLLMVVIQYNLIELINRQYRCDHSSL
jgi:hypothetical protein